MARKQKQYHFIYKTTCLVTGKFYVGMHSTDNLNDGYLGSGKILGYSRRKHGDENHKLEILEMCGSRELLKQREKEIVNEELLAHPLNINLKYGGEGGWDQARNSNSVLSKEQLSERSKRGWKTLRAKPGALEMFSIKARNQGIKLNEWLSEQTHLGMNYRGFHGKTHTDTAKKQIGAKNSIHQSGSGNSQFGTKWVTSAHTGAIKIAIGEVEKYLALGFSPGRKTL